MPASKAQQKAVNKYMRENYDRIGVTMPKGRKAEIQSVAAAAGQSVNAYINQAIASRMESSGVQSSIASDNVSGGGGVLTPETLRLAAEAAQKPGKTPETVAEFIQRAVELCATTDGRQIGLCDPVDAWRKRKDAEKSGSPG